MTAVGKETDREAVDNKFRYIYEQARSLCNTIDDLAAWLGDAGHDDEWLASPPRGYDNTTPDGDHNGLTGVQQVRAALTQAVHISDLIQNRATQPGPDDLLYWLRRFANI